MGSDLIVKHQEYIQKYLCVQSKNDDIKETPSNYSEHSTPSNSESSKIVIPSILKPSTMNHRKLRKKKSNRSNRGLLALSNAKNIKNTKIDGFIESYQQKTARKKRRRHSFSANTKNKNEYKMRSKSNEEEQEWLTAENVFNAFNIENDYKLKDNSKYMELQKIACSENNGVRRDWRKLREIALNGNWPIEIDGNWPIEPRFYGPESVEYEQQISRIKKQYLNGLNNANNNSYEIIGDLMNRKKTFSHPITINNGRTNGEHTNHRNENKITMQKKIESLLKEEMDKNKELEKFRKLRTKIFNTMWKNIKNKEKIDCDKKVDKKILEDYVEKKFDGMFMILDDQF